MNELFSRVLKVNVKEFGDGAYVLYSASKRDPKETLGDFQVKNHFSFAYIVGDWAAEWEPQNGPIQVWHKCNKDDEGAKEHYIFEYHNSGGFNWSQLSVDRLELPQAAFHANWQYIFNVLKDWAERN